MSADLRPLALVITLGLLACNDDPDRPSGDGQPADARHDLTRADLSPPSGDAAVVDAGNTDARQRVTCSALVVTGDPKAGAGAKWTYKATDDGAAYDLQGVLFRPQGSGPFPGVVLSHGKGGSPTGFPTMLAKQIVQWGVVGIATAYTHAGNPSGLPTGPDGASAANVQRAHKARGLLGCLGYVKMDRIAAHGHSMGAFVTTALVGTHPGDYHVASHTAGGVNSYAAPPYPSDAQANAITAPYQIHHGANDTVVPPKDDQALADLLTKNNVSNELHSYPGFTHNEVATDANMLGRVKSWYGQAGLW